MSAEQRLPSFGCEVEKAVADKLDHQPCVFTVKRHVRGKWVCRCSAKIVQVPMPGHVIDQDIPTAGLLAHLLVAKFMSQPRRRLTAASLVTAWIRVASG